MVKRDYLLFAAVCILVLLLSGCVGDKTGGATWWNPTTWASRAAPAAADRAADKRDQAADALQSAEDKAVRAANVELAKAQEILRAAGEGREVSFARRFLGNARSLLNMVEPLNVAEELALRQQVADLLSANAELRAAAESAVAASEKAIEAQGARLEQARTQLARRDTALARANSNLREAYDRENALANQVRNFWFIVGALVLLWLGGNLLAAAARFYPPLAGVSRVVNGIAAPALAFAEARAQAGLQRVGHAMAEVRQKLPAVAGQLVEIFDQHADADHQRAIGAAANNAPRT